MRPIQLWGCWVVNLWVCGKISASAWREHRSVTWTVEGPDTVLQQKWLRCLRGSLACRQEGFWEPVCDLDPQEEQGPSGTHRWNHRKAEACLSVKLRLKSEQSRGRRLPGEVVSSLSLEVCKKRVENSWQGSCRTHPSLHSGWGQGEPDDLGGFFHPTRCGEG